MPSNDEINAAFDAVQPELRALVAQLPGFEQGTASNAMNSPNGRQEQVRILRLALTAAEAVRNKPQKASSPR